MAVKLTVHAGRVGGGGFPPPPLTEPDLWAAHPALRDVGVGPRGLAPTPGFRPQLSKVQPKLNRDDDAC